jgi:thiamine-phosphate pyrophosphorylase
VLEEYSKLVDPNLGSYFKDIRYELYVLESALASHPLKEKLKEATLYLVTEPSENMLSQVEKALQGGIKIVQLREKNALGDEFLTKAKAMRELTLKHEALFIVNDRADIAILSDADGLHIGQDDMPIAEARKLMGSRIIGVSTHKIEEARKAAADGADYIGMGPVYATPTKEGRVPVGLDYIKQVAKEIEIPAYAIGGINLDNIEEVKSAGAVRFAVVREIMRADKPDEVVKKLHEKIDKQEVLA